MNDTLDQEEAKLGPIKLAFRFKCKGIELAVSVEGRHVRISSSRDQTLALGTMINGRLDVLREIRHPLDPKDWFWMHQVDCLIREKALSAVFPPKG